MSDSTAHETEGTVKVLSIIGWGRSGSTLLTNVLGEIEGFFGTGELHYLWLRGLIANGRCGCQQHVLECPLWQEITSSDRFVTAMGGRSAQDVVRMQDEAVKMSNLRRIMAMEPGKPTGWGVLDDYLHILDETYRAIAEQTGAKVIIDSSKRPVNAAILRLLPSVEPYVVHLVRDPRGVAYSRSRKKSAFGHVMAQHGSANSTLRWLYRNRSAEKLLELVDEDKRMLLRYEDFVSSPREWISKVAHLVGEHPGRFPFEDENTVSLGPNHAVSGNQSRFLSGRIKIDADQAWITEQRASDRLLATTLALPRLAHYGYPVRARSENQQASPGGRS